MGHHNKMSLAAVNAVRSRLTSSHSGRVYRLMTTPKLGQNVQVRRSFMTSLETGAKTARKSPMKILYPYRIGAAGGLVGLQVFVFGLQGTKFAETVESVTGTQWCVINFCLNYFVGLPLLYTIFAVTFPI